MTGILPAGTEYLARLRAQGLQEHARAFDFVLRIARAVQEAGGRALLVGGCVRDMLLGRVPKDYDLEVYGLAPERLRKLARRFGTVSEVGAAFGILKLRSPEGVEIDLSLPRRDSKIGPGHRGFAVRTDPFMRVEDACRRRDFTINAMAADPITGELFDPFGGYRDLQARVLRVTDAERFGDDPLRVMRGLQFAARFGLTADEESKRVMRAMVPSLRELPKERFLDEWRKLLLQAPTPSVGLRLGMELGVFHALYPQFAALPETPQDPAWHPEGDVWTHTLLTVDQAAAIRDRDQLSDEAALVLLLAALCHDLGKPATTAVRDGRITSRGHEAAGVEPADRFLDQIGVDLRTREKVTRLVAEHTWPRRSYRAETERGERVRDGAIRRLAARLVPATIAELVLVAEADHAGRGFFRDAATGRLTLPERFPAGEWLRARAAALDVLHGPPADVIRGQDLLTLGLTPGPAFGAIIRAANRLRDEGEFTREQILAHLAGVRDAEQALSRLEALLGGGARQE